MRKLELVHFTRSARQLAYSVQIGGLQFSTSIWYDSVDFVDLEATYGSDFMRRIYFHIVAFDINRLVSLRPDTIDFGPFQDLVSPSFSALWHQIFAGVWGQWRYENDLPDYGGPQFVGLSEAEPTAIAVVKTEASPPNLAFCGGGKDSLFALSLLEEAGEAFDSLVYSHSIYGSHAAQHGLIDRLLDHTAVGRRHRVWICDDFLAVPILSLAPELGVRSITAAETPSSAFIALPVAMAHGFQRLVLAHEKSADSGNMEWAVTGETINHQWGKSFAAELLLSTYIEQRLLSNVHYFSLLKPVQDVVIFSALQGLTVALPFAHSCNIEKPWCKRCAKCAYVWLNYAAYLPEDTVMAIFGENLFDVDENLIWFRQLLGLEAHTPFECVGEVEESRLAFALCGTRGYTGRAMALCEQEGEIEKGSLEELFTVATGQHLIPPSLAGKVVPLLEKKAAAGRAYVGAALARS